MTPPSEFPSSTNNRHHLLFSKSLNNLERLNEQSRIELRVELLTRYCQPQKTRCYRYHSYTPMPASPSKRIPIPSTNHDPHQPIYYSLSLCQLKDDESHAWSLYSEIRCGRCNWGVLFWIALRNRGLMKKKTDTSLFWKKRMCFRSNPSKTFRTSS